jgi:RNA polymerase sigma-70 factor, ECF subfamily
MSASEKQDVLKQDALNAAVEAARAGDENAFRLVYRAVHPGLLRYVRGLVGDDAEDVASEAWLQITRGLSSFAGDSDAFRGWVATIARNRALDYLRYQRRRPVAAYSDEALAEHADARDTSADALSSLASERALSLIRSLPPDQAEAVLLRVVMGLDAKTSAKVLGKRAGAVRTACYRGLQRLSALMTAAEDGWPKPRRGSAASVTPPMDLTLKGRDD